MPPSDEETLKNLSFFKDYQDKKDELIDGARVVYGSFKAKNTTLSKDECKTVYGAGLHGSRLFKEMAGKKGFLDPAVYEAIALVLARYVVEKHWTEITR